VTRADSVVDRVIGALVARVENGEFSAGERLPPETDRKALAEFVLTAMEGGVMQARTHRDVVYFDRVVAMLRDHFDMLALQARGKALA